MSRFKIKKNLTPRQLTVPLLRPQFGGLKHIHKKPKCLNQGFVKKKKKKGRETIGHHWSKY